MTLSAYSFDQDESFPITDGLAEVNEPVFDRSGKYLYLFGSTDAGPVLDWFAQSTAENRRTRNVYLVVLAQGHSRRRSRARATRRSRPDKPSLWPAPRPTGGAGDRPRRGAAPKPRRWSRSGSISTASNTASSICRSPPAISSSLPAGAAGQLYLPARQRRRRRSRRAGRRRCRSCTASTSPSARTSASSTTCAPIASRPTARRCSTPRATPGRSSRCRPATGSTPSEGRLADWPTSRCGSTRAPSGSRFSTRPGASTATTSTPRTCTASTGRRCGRSTRAFLADLAVRSDLNASSSGCRASWRSGHHRVGGGDRLETPQDRTGRAARRRLQRSRTAATGSRRSTAGSTGTRSCARR